MPRRRSPFRPSCGLAWQGKEEDKKGRDGSKVVVNRKPPQKHRDLAALLVKSWSGICICICLGFLGLLGLLGLLGCLSLSRDFLPLLLFPLCPAQAAGIAQRLGPLGPLRHSGESRVPGRKAAGSAFGEISQTRAACYLTAVRADVYVQGLVLPPPFLIYRHCDAGVALEQHGTGDPHR